MNESKNAFKFQFVKDSLEINVKPEDELLISESYSSKDEEQVSNSKSSVKSLE